MIVKIIIKSTEFKKNEGRNKTKKNFRNKGIGIIHRKKSKNRRVKNSKRSNKRT